MTESLPHSETALAPTAADRPETPFRRSATPLLVALAAGPGAYGTVSWFFGSIVGRLVLFVYTWILMHHMLGGLRHFIWDLGYGFDRAQRMGLARATLIGSVILTVLIWALALTLR